jgi:hypothetical protein
MIVERRQNPPMEDGAIWSDDRKCRFSLWRHLNAVGREVVFIMLNPSTASAYRDDATVKKVMKLSWKWGYSRLKVLNVYPHVSTDPRELDRRLGRAENLRFFDELRQTNMTAEADRIVCAWGKHAKYEDVAPILKRIRSHPNVCALRRNLDGSPEHPLYIPAAVEPVVYP